MDNNAIFVKRRIFDVFLLFIRHIGFICLFGYRYAYAFDITITPSISTQEIYSDNINLSQSSNQKSGFVTDMSPGVSILGQSARSYLSLNYRMQNLYNAGGNNGIKIANQLQYNSKNTLISNRLFLDSRSTISQQNVNNNQIASDNISGVGNSTNVSTFSMSPYWTPQFGNYANGNIRLDFDTVTTSSPSSNNSASLLNTISDTINLAEIINLNSGTEFQRVNWSLSHKNSKSYRLAGDDVSFQNTDAIVRTYINKYFNVFVKGGYSNNNFQTSTDMNKNGLAYTFGGQWKPSQYYSIEAGGGNNSYVTVDISPMQRLSWSTTFRNNSIGLNSGKTWQTSLNYRTRQSIWALAHDNDTTTTQEILLQQQVFAVKDPFGNAIIDPVTNQAVQRAINLPTLSNEVIVRKKWNFSVSFNTGKSTIAVNAYNEDRVFQVSGNDQKVRGLGATWNWQFASKTNAYIHPLWQQTDKGMNAKDDRYDLLIGVNRLITNHINGKLEFRHINQSSDRNVFTNSFQTPDLNNNYQENRATVSLYMRY